MTRMTRQVVMLLAALAAGGCGTSKEARELSIETAAAVQSLDVALTANANAARKAAVRADARIGNLVLRTANQRADLNARMAADDSANSSFERLRSFAETQEAQRQKEIAEASKAAQALAEAREKAKSPSPALKEVSDNLTALGREESAWERLSSTVQFVRDVTKRVKQDGEAAQEATEAGTSAAKEESEKPDDDKHGAEKKGSEPEQQ